LVLNFGTCHNKFGGFCSEIQLKYWIHLCSHVSRRTSFAGSYVGSNANLLPGGWGNARNSIEDERRMGKKMRKKEERGERKEGGGEG
jgi:hypothetical protein